MLEEFLSQFISIDESIYHSQVFHWSVALVSFFIALFAIIYTRSLLIRILKNHFASKIWFQYVNRLIQSNPWPMFFAFAVFASLSVSPIPHEYKAWLSKVFAIGLVLQVGVWLNVVADVLINNLSLKSVSPTHTHTTVHKAILTTTKFIIWAGVLLLILDNFGVDITTLITGLGIGGVAIALGVQKILGDIFASLSILLDKPFVIGDFIIVGDLKGTVEDIGIKTTRLRSLSGERLIFSNSDLLGSRLRNYAQIVERRESLKIGVTYETPPEKLDLAVQLIKQAIESQESTRLDFVAFREFGDFSLNIEAAYFGPGDFSALLKNQQNINFQILRSFNENKIDFAYPTQKLLMTNSEVKT